MPGTLLLDSEALSKLYRKHREVMTWVATAHREDIRVGTTAMTLVEADFERVHPARVDWVLSRVDVHEITKDLAKEAAGLLRANRLHGHRHAIDAVLAAVARSVTAPATVLTSDPDDMARLCGPRIAVVKV